MIIYNASAATVIPVACQTFLNIQTATAYKTIAATTCIKSPLEKEKSMMNVKQHTIAGPRSPSIRKDKIVITIAASANAKKYNLLFQDGYCEIKFSFFAKNPAIKRMIIYFTISLGWNPNRFTLTPLPSGPVPNKIVRHKRPTAPNAHGQPLAALLPFLNTNRRKNPESAVNFLRFTNWRARIPVMPRQK